MSLLSFDTKKYADIAKIVGVLFVLFGALYTYIDGKYQKRLDEQLNLEFRIKYSFEQSYQDDMQSIQKQYEKLKKDKSDIKWTDMMYLPNQCRRLSDLSTMISNIGLIKINNELIELSNYCTVIKKEVMLSMNKSEYNWVSKR